MTDTITLRDMTMFDIMDVLEIEEKTGSGSGWTDTGLLTYLLRDDTLFYVATEPAADADDAEAAADEALVSADSTETSVDESAADSIAAPADESAENEAVEGSAAEDDAADDEPAEVIVGYVGLLMVPFEGDILNIAVREDRRRRGIASKLMEKVLHEAYFNGVTDVHLEVRESNEAALRLYEKFGFVRDGLRKRYYTNPVENAVTMTHRQG
ncbi:MAG: ribosomal protein S18-alanine N-acetyltransferase [Lachnospiraceae bacterium]|nr:ribosomal protein S18-alanine N-acetyltransferase [Lachnospiraceae bacterium]